MQLGYQITQNFTLNSKMLTKRQSKLLNNIYRQKKCQKSLKLEYSKFDQ